MAGKAQEMKTYTDEEAEVSIKYPATWDYQQNPQTTFIFMRPLEKEGQIFKENVNLIINNDQGLSLEEYVGASKAQLNNQLPGYKLLSTEYLELGGKKYGRIIYQHNAQNLPLQVAYYIYLEGGKAYNLTCSTIRKNFEEYLPVFQKMVSSFKVKDK